MKNKILGVLVCMLLMVTTITTAVPMKSEKSSSTIQNSDDTAPLPPPGYKFSVVGFSGQADITSVEKVGFFRRNLEVDILDGFMQFYKAHAEPGDQVSLINFIPFFTLREGSGYKVEGNVLLEMIGICWYKITEN